MMTDAAGDKMPFGDTHAIGTRLRKIAEQLDAQGGLWTWALDHGRAGDPIRDILLRALLLIGNEPVVLADGDLGETDEPEGFATLITPSRLVRATFGGYKNDYGRASLEATVEVVPLSSVRRVVAEAAFQGRHEDAPWPNVARLVLHLDQEVSGTRELIVPTKDAAARLYAVQVAELAARLPLL